ncbi:MAG: VWA domain-containing protein, partial [Planctomycetota bacterium]
RLVLVVDASESMGFGSLDSIDSPGDEWTKYDHAIAIAATMAYMGTRQGDSVGLAIFDQVVSRYFKPSSQPGTWRQLVTELAAVPRWNQTSIGKVLEQVTGKLTGRSVVVVLSDFFDDLDAIQKGLRMLRHKGHEVLACQILDPQEIRFPFEDVTMFEGLEEAGELLTEPRALREAYIQQMADHTDELAHKCRRMGIDFERFDSGEPLDVAISTFLARRADRLRLTS